LRAGRRNKIEIVARKDALDEGRGKKIGLERVESMAGFQKRFGASFRPHILSESEKVQKSEENNSEQEECN